MQIKVDEDLPHAVADVFRVAGHDVETVPGQGWTGWADDRIWAAVAAEGRMLLTADKGLADIRRVRSAKTDIGVVLLRLEHESWQGYRSLARKLVASVPWRSSRRRGSGFGAPDAGARIARRR